MPLLPFFRFGGAAREVYTVESQRFEQVYGDTIQKIEYDQVLKSVSKDWRELARDTVQLAAKVASTRSVLVCMSFANRPDFKDLLAAIKTVCAEFDYQAERVDESNLSKRVVPQILAQVKRSAFVVVDVTEPKPNVFYELGFADGAGRDVVVVAKKGTICRSTSLTSPSSSGRASRNSNRSFVSACRGCPDSTDGGDPAASERANAGIVTTDRITRPAQAVA